MSRFSRQDQENSSGKEIGDWDFRKSQSPTETDFTKTTNYRWKSMAFTKPEPAA
ncbi:hypothetical protein BRCON_2753 [Candidatus Sumerlaea chitinivorans]|uniref:Uncharacterized protein n=1 Tax=Sumerlaea chitinivorans TaxID=2250252 RepID=A0A2Z4YAU7_SUMC1|nr:hypothetical protein BRCON_2753 [Candidatus Sumerlaea chitinivorans]